ncbi:MAG: Rid family hydrolase [Candidatus Obscuribacter sp.]|nr:RidA family protein [Candidatus Melainabacteria bacterium]MDX1988020.1 Rid family hydrolase [Candidatus Obscuribacter sp.]
MIKEAVNPGQASPSPLGAYSHALRVGDLLFISGQGCRDPKTGVECGLTLDEKGQVLAYDIEVQTRGVLENLGVVLRHAGLDYSDLVDMTVFLHDMQDFERYNKVYAGYFSGVAVPPTRTTVQVARLPGRNYIEIKAIASFG